MLQLSQRPLTGSDADAELFVGRKRELDRLERAIHLRFNVMVLGDRGAGTTSLLHQVARRLRASDVDVHVVDTGEAHSLDELIGRLVAVVGNVATPERPTINDLAAFANDSTGAGPIVMIDNLVASDLVPQLFGASRDDLWELPFRWVVAGQRGRRARYLAPPADAFFDTVIEIDELAPEEAESLLLRRAEAPGSEDDPDADRLRALAAPLALQLRPRLPRSLLAAARNALLADDTPGDLSQIELHRRATELGLPAVSLLTELGDLGPISTSDRRLLDRLGWTRGRAVQVVKQLEAAGLVTSTTDDTATPGRPRKLYAVNQHPSDEVGPA